jgi:hypothetical protein
MTKDDALRMMLGPFKAWRDVPGNEDVVEELTKIINAVEKVLAQEKALQALHNENERLGLYRDAYAEQEPVKLPCCGYADASAVKWNPFNRVCQCHNCGQTYTPPAQPPQRTEQEPVAHLWECLGRWSAYLVTNGTQAECAPPSWLVDAVKNATTPSQRTEQNFCSRCGKRTPDLITIHTCTPPKEKSA